MGFAGSVALEHLSLSEGEASEGAVRAPGGGRNPTGACPLGPEESEPWGRAAQTPGQGAWRIPRGISEDSCA